MTTYVGETGPLLSQYQRFIAVITNPATWTHLNAIQYTLTATLTIYLNFIIPLYVLGSHVV